MKQKFQITFVDSDLIEKKVDLLYDMTKNHGRLIHSPNQTGDSVGRNFTCLKVTRFGLSPFDRNFSTKKNSRKSRYRFTSCQRVLKH